MCQNLLSLIENAWINKYTFFYCDDNQVILLSSFLFRLRSLSYKSRIFGSTPNLPVVISQEMVMKENVMTEVIMNKMSE